MSPLSLVVMIVVVAVASANKVVPGHEPLHAVHPAEDSAEVEKHFNPTVQALEHGQHKLTFKNDEGQESCLVCQPFQGCGCSDIAAIRCELKRLKEKLLRLHSLAHPTGQHSVHHELHSHAPVAPHQAPEPHHETLHAAVQPKH